MLWKQQRKYHFNNSVLSIKFGDIVEADTDVIVSSDDYLLPMGDGLAAYLLEKGGPEIRNDAKSPYNKSLEYDLCNRHWIQLKDMDSMEDLGRQLNENIRFYLNRKD